MQCETCRWWNENDYAKACQDEMDPQDKAKLHDGERLGWCVRFPPVSPVYVSGCRWPLVNSGAFCGEWKSNKPLPE